MHRLQDLLIVLTSSLCLLMSGCKTRPSGGGHEQSSLGQHQDRGDDILRVEELAYAKQVDGKALKVRNIVLKSQQLRDRPHSFALVQVDKDAEATYLEYELCQAATCWSDYTTNGEFTLSGLAAFRADAVFTFRVRPCVEPEQAASKDHCGAWVSYEQFKGAPFVLGKQANAELDTYFSEIALLEKKIKANGLKLVNHLRERLRQQPDDDPAFGDLKTSHLVLVGGHHLGQAMLSDAYQNHSLSQAALTLVEPETVVRPAPPKGEEEWVCLSPFCFSKQDYDKLASDDQCKIDRRLGSLEKADDWSWQDDILCQGPLCKGTIGCVASCEVQRYLGSAAPECGEKYSHHGLRIGGAVVTAMGSAALGAGAVLVAKGRSKGEPATITLGAAGLAAVAAGLVMMLKAEGYFPGEGASSQGWQSTLALIAEVRRENGQYEEELWGLSRKVNAVLANAGKA